VAVLLLLIGLFGTTFSLYLPAPMKCEAYFTGAASLKISQFGRKEDDRH